MIEVCSKTNGKIMMSGVLSFSNNFSETAKKNRIFNVIKSIKGANKSMTIFFTEVFHFIVIRQKYVRNP